MNALRKSSSASFALFTVVGVLTLAQSALADGGALRRGDSAVEALLALPAEAAPAPEWKVPTRLEITDENELREAHLISLADFLPQGRLSQKPPFIDFSKLELGGYVGIVGYSSDFEADPSGVGGVVGRVPVPGIPLGDWGIWAKLFMSYINRDLAFFYKNQANYWYGGAAGVDYTVLSNEYVYLRAQVGLLYAYWNDVRALDDGVGILVGAEFGIFWIKHNNKASFVLTPHLSFDGDNYIGFFTVGFQADF